MTSFIKHIQKNYLLLLSGLGMFSLLAGSVTLTVALGMSLAVLLHLVISSLIIFWLRRLIHLDIRFIAHLIIIATVATAISQLMSAYMPVWIQGIELFIPLLALNGMVLYQLDLHEQVKHTLDVFLHACTLAISFLLLIIPLSILSELLGQGVIQLQSLTDADLTYFTFTLIPEDYRIGIFTGPYGYLGSLMILGLFIAFVQTIRIRRGNR
jgi:Na+-translocating ferredoxin:NAD+ oxidoreductase RnfE subunit